MRSLGFLILCLVTSCSMPDYIRGRELLDHRTESEILADVGSVIPGVVQIFSVNGLGEGISRGSGVVVYRGRYSLILTARHMTEGEGVASWVVKKDKWSVTARCIKRGVGDLEDWALLETDYPVGDAVRTLDPVKFSEFCSPYAPVVCVGYALGWPTVTVTVGHVQELGPEVVRMSAPIMFGNSGGGMFVLVSGRLVLAGITVAIGSSGGHVAPHMGVSVSIATISRRGGLSR